MILVLSGCVENVPEEVSGIGDKASSIVDDGLNYIDTTFNGQDADLINGVSTLPIMDDTTVDTFEGYQNFADSVNVLFTFLNRESGYDFQVLKGTREEYEKISKIVTEYSPLIGNYNDVVNAAKNYDEGDPESEKEFYTALGIFGLEFGIIYATVWYSPTYKAVGMVYRWSGLNRLALFGEVKKDHLITSKYFGTILYTIDPGGG